MKARHIPKQTYKNSASLFLVTPDTVSYSNKLSAMSHTSLAEVKEITYSI